MKKVIGVILIIVALALGYFGVNELRSSSTSVDIMGLEISTENKNAKDIAQTKIGLGVIALIAGVYLVGKKNR